MKKADAAALFAFRALRSLLRFLPQRSALALGRGAGRIAAACCPRECRIARAQAAAAARSLPDSEQRNKLQQLGLINKVFAHVGQAVVESMFLDRFLQPLPSAVHEFRGVTSQGQEHVDELIRNGQGAVTLSGHVGSFELLAAFHVASGAQVSVIGRIPNYSGVEIALRELRTAYGVEVLWRNDPSAARKLIEALRAGRVVAALIDQDVNLENTFVPFFGRPAAYPSAVIRLAIKKKVPILSSFIVRTAATRHRVITDRIAYDPDDPQAVEHVLRIFNGRLEALICEYPEQWIWWHRRWRRRPGENYDEHPEHLRSTAEYVRWLESSENDFSKEQPETML
jgi:KDO2-lipid IV(A) lauroyltransferase